MEKRGNHDENEYETDPQQIRRNFDDYMIMVRRRLTNGLTPTERAMPRILGLFDMCHLEGEFAKVCPDYLIKLSSLEEDQTAKTFAFDILFNLNLTSSWAPQKTLRLSNRDPINGDRKDNHIVLYCHRYERPPGITLRPKVINGTLHLTIKQACLLALKKFEEVVELSAARGDYLLTKHVADVFNGSLVELYNDLRRAGVTYDMVHLVKLLNESAYDGGQNLEFSDLHAAVVRTIAGTTHLRDHSAAKDIVAKKVWLYLKAGKKVDMKVLEVFAKHARRGVLVINHKGRNMLLEWVSSLPSSPSLPAEGGKEEAAGRELVGSAVPKSAKDGAKDHQEAKSADSCEEASSSDNSDDEFITADENSDEEV